MAVAMVGLGYLTVPRAMRRLMLVVGVRLPADERERVAAWLLITLGLAVALVGRAAT